MYATNGNATRVRWEVLWIAKGKRQRKAFEHDLMGAVELYTKVVQAGRKGATLRSCNMAFPPSDEYADWVEGRFEIIKRGRKKYKKPLPDVLILPRAYRHRMHAMNIKGAWWCPFCMKFRRFARREGFELEGIWVDEPAMACPMCKISHRDGSVARYNPIAARYLNMRRRRSDTGVPRA